MSMNIQCFAAFSVIFVNSVQMMIYIIIPHAIFYNAFFALRPPHRVLISFTYIVRFPLLDRYWLLVA